MPKKCSTAKSASAAYQCEKAITRCADGDPSLVWASVHGSKGNGFFTLRLENGSEVRGTPRGLFTKGNMPVSTGHIVVASGDKKGMEIVGVLSSRARAEEFVADGKMPRMVFAAALSAAAIDDAVDSEEDIGVDFEAPEAVEVVEEVNPHGLSAQRSKAEHLSNVAKKLAALTGKLSVVHAPKTLLPSTGEIDIDAI